MNRTRLTIGAAGLLVGFLLVLALPASAVFVTAAGAGAEEDGDARYACPMFCVILDEMPEDGRCPICSMELTVVSNESRLNAGERHMIGLEAGRLRRRPLVKTVRLVGEVDYDENRVTRVTTRMAGWLEEVFVTATWEEVEKGQKLFSIYAPELYEAQQDLLVAKRGGDAALLAAARRRLALLGVGEEEIAEIERSGEIRRALVIRAPRDGVVVERRAVEDESAKKGERLYTIADLDRVWIQAEVFESDLPWIRVGQPVRVESVGFDEPREARVAFVDPAIDRTSRTARVRIEFDNRPGPDGRRPLRIGQRVDAVLEARLDADGKLVAPGSDPEEDPFALPRSAVLTTGKRSIAYVLFTERETPEGKRPEFSLDPDRLPRTVWYELVPLRIGPLARLRDGGPGEEYYPILGIARTAEPGSLAGLEEGVVFVTSGNLLVDSQAQLSGKPSLLFPEGNRSVSTDPHAGH
jgi:multidrug efflux pump subunit AcrA (membrane-fusion protein)